MRCGILTLSAALLAGCLSGPVAEDAASVNVDCDNQDLDEEFMASLLSSLGFDCGDGAKWGYSESRYFDIKGYESILFVGEQGQLLAACYGAYNVPEELAPRARETVAKLNETSSEVEFRFDGNEIWCEYALTIEALRRKASPAEQREVLVRMLELTAKNIQDNRAVLDRFNAE